MQSVKKLSRWRRLMGLVLAVVMVASCMTVLCISVDAAVNDVTVTKTIDYLGDGGNNPDTNVDDAGNSTIDLEDYYRLYLTASATTNPIDLLLVIDRSGSMGSKVSTASNAKSRVENIRDFLCGASNKGGFIENFLKLNSKNRIAAVWFGESNSARPRADNGKTVSAFSNSAKGSTPASNYCSSAGVIFNWRASRINLTATTVKSGTVVSISSNDTNIGSIENGATNYMSGLWRARDMMRLREDSTNEKVVLFLTDGIPTLANHLNSSSKWPGLTKNGGATYSNHNSTASSSSSVKIREVGTGGYDYYYERPNLEKTNNSDVTFASSIVGYTQAACEEFNTYAKQQKAKVFAIKYLLETDKDFNYYSNSSTARSTTSKNTLRTYSNNILNAMIKGTGGSLIDIANQNQFTSKMEEIIASMRKLSIKDTLSGYVDFAGTTPAAAQAKVTMKIGSTVTVLYENGASKNTSKLSGVTISGKTITATFNPSYKMEDGAIYTLSFNVKLSDSAKSSYASSGSYGGTTGAANTDYPGNSTSSGKPGYRSNSTATATYTPSGKSETSKNYPHPVVQVHIPENKNLIRIYDFSQPLPIGKGEIAQYTCTGGDTHSNWTGSIEGISKTKPNVTLNKGTTEDIAGFGTADQVLTGGTVKVGADGLRFIPKVSKDTSVDIVYCKVKIGSYFLYSSVTIVPATNVHYEQSNAGFTVGSGWTSKTEGTGAATANQQSDNAIYGNDVLYKNSVNLYSDNTYLLATVNNPNVTPTTTFHFKGTGFDVISRTTPNDGVMVVDIFNNADMAQSHLVKAFIVDNYLARYSLYQIPVVHIDSLNYGSYYVRIRAYYNKGLDHNYKRSIPASEQSILEKLGYASNANVEFKYATNGTAPATRSTRAASGSYEVVIDGIRIYNPMGLNVTGDALNAYKSATPSELNPVYTQVHDILCDSTNWTGTNADGVVYIADGSKASSSTTVEHTGVYLSSQGIVSGYDEDKNAIFYDNAYKSDGPENEVYLQTGSGVAFSFDPDATVHLSMKSLGSETAGYRIYDLEKGTSTTGTATTATELFYDVGAAASSGKVAVICTSGTLSVCQIKIAGSATRGIHFDAELAYQAMKLFTSEAAELPIRARSLNLQNYIGVDYTIRNADFAEYDNFYVAARIGDGEEQILPVVKTVGTAYTVFECKATAAQMTLPITASVYAVKDGVTYHGGFNVWTIRDGAMELIESSTSQSAKALAANMLAYGAKAQLAFGVATDDLADAQLGDAVAYVDVSDAAAAKPHADGEATGFKRASLALESAVELQLVFAKNGHEAASLEARITDQNGTRTVDISDISAQYAGFTVVPSVSALRDEMTIAVFDKNSGEQLTQTLTGSIAGFAAVKLDEYADNAEMTALIHAMLHYGDCVRAHF